MTAMPLIGQVFSDGTIYAGNGVYLPSDGREVSREGFAVLFSVLGTSYGNGDGVETFNLPNSGAFVHVLSQSPEQAKSERGIRGRDLIDVMSYEDIARACGIEEDTLRRYKRGGRMPPPDDLIGATPLWHSSTIRDWMANRPRAKNQGES